MNETREMLIKRIDGRVWYHKEELRRLECQLEALKSLSEDQLQKAADIIQEHCRK